MTFEIRTRLNGFINLISEKAMNKAEIYFKENRIQNFKFDSGLLTARVKGSFLYDTYIDLRNKRADYNCSCPAPLPCKHIVALMIYALSDKNTYTNVETSKFDENIYSNQTKNFQTQLRIGIQEDGSINITKNTEMYNISLNNYDVTNLELSHFELYTNLNAYNNYSGNITRMPESLFIDDLIPKDIEFYSIVTGNTLIRGKNIYMESEILMYQEEEDTCRIEISYNDPITSKKIILSLDQNYTRHQSVDLIQKFVIYKLEGSPYFSPIVSNPAISYLRFKTLNNFDSYPVLEILKEKDNLGKQGLKGLNHLPPVLEDGPKVCMTVDPIVRKNGLQLELRMFYGYKQNSLSSLKRLNSNKKDFDMPFNEFAIFPLREPIFQRVSKKIQKSINNKFAFRNSKSEKILYSKIKNTLNKNFQSRLIIPQNKILEFMNVSINEFIKNKFQIQINKDLKNLTQNKKKDFNIEIQSSGIDWFEFQFLIPKEYQKVLPSLIKQNNNNQNFFQNKDGSWISLESLGIKKFLRALETLGYQSGDLLKKKLINKGEAVAFLMEYEEELDLRSTQELDRIRSHLNQPKHKVTSNSNIKLKSQSSLSSIKFNGKLRPYQYQGVEFLEHLSSIGIGGILADDMGLGKTVQCIYYLNKRYQESKKKELYLIVGPLAALNVWTIESDKFATDLPISVWHGQDRRNIKFPKSGILLTTYGTLVRDSEIIIDKKFDVCLIDEAQNIKNYQANASKILRKLKSKLYFCITGTPIENNLLELWALFDLFFPGYLGKKKQFISEYSNKLKLDSHKLGKLNKKITPFILRRSKEEVLKELPSKMINLVRIPMTDYQKNEYLKAKALAYVELKNSGNDYLMKLLPHLMKLRRIASHPVVHLGAKANPSHSGKFAYIQESIDEIRSSSNGVLVFSQFTDVLAIFGSILEKRKIPYFYLDGKTTAKKRQDLVARFQAGENHFFLISLKAGGTALTLTRANFVIHLDPWWNPAVELQATDRVHRIGQKNSVFVYKLYSEQTIEEKVIELQNKKLDLFNGIFGGNLKNQQISKEELLMLLE